MKKGIKRGIVIAFVLCIVLGSFGCGKKEWWEDRSKIDVVFSDPLATPNALNVHYMDLEATKNIAFSYNYDGEEHFPEAKILVGGEEKGYVFREGKQIFLEEEGRYNVIAGIVHRGKYIMDYRLYKTKDISKRDYFSSLIIYLEIL